jgi:hypothetical protein
MMTRLASVLPFLVLGLCTAALDEGAASVTEGRNHSREQTLPEKPETDPVAAVFGDRLSRRGVPENEAGAVDACVSYVEAQFAYFRSAHSVNGARAFAQRIRSAPGKQDGLYWAPQSGEDESPVGPPFAAAAVTEDGAGSQPFFGYYYKVLQWRPEAQRGTRDYHRDNPLAGGFALVAWPAEYGVTGVRSFLVDHRGIVYAKDLGPRTARTARGMSVFAPDRTWAVVHTGLDERER